MTCDRCKEEGHPTAGCTYSEIVAAQKRMAWESAERAKFRRQLEELRMEAEALAEAERRKSSLAVPQKEKNVQARLSGGAQVRHEVTAGSGHGQNLSRSSQQQIASQRLPLTFTARQQQRQQEEELAAGDVSIASAASARGTSQKTVRSISQKAGFRGITGGIGGARKPGGGDGAIAANQRGGSGSALPVTLEESQRRADLQAQEELERAELIRLDMAMAAGSSALAHVTSLCGGIAEPNRRCGNVREQAVCEHEDRLDAASKLLIRGEEERKKNLRDLELAVIRISAKARQQGSGTTAQELSAAESALAAAKSRDEAEERQYRENLERIKAEKESVLGDLDRRTGIVKEETQGADSDDYRAFERAVGEHKAGTCAEFACAALAHLNSQFRNCAPLSALNYRCDRYPDDDESTYSFQHTVVGIGGTRGNPLVICDPWANLCCGFEEYAGQFATRMSDWRRSGLKVRSDGGAADPVDFRKVVEGKPRVEE